MIRLNDFYNRNYYIHFHYLLYYEGHHFVNNMMRCLHLHNPNKSDKVKEKYIAGFLITCNY